MSNKITLATIQFRADTKGVNPALDAMRQSAKDAHDEMDRMQEALDKGIKKMKDANGVEFDVADKFRQAQKAAKSYDQALRELVKGATALETVVQNIRLGEIEKSSRAELKGAINAAEARKRSVRESDPEDLQQQRELNQVIEESRKQLNNLDRDTQKVIETLDKGGVVAQATLDKEIKGLKEILTLIPKGIDEWNKYNQQLTQMEAHVASIRRQEREAAVLLLGSKDFGRYSEEEIRTAITNARELLATYKTASPEAKALADNIVRADQYLKEHGIEAARQAARQAEELRQEKELRKVMNGRMKDLTTLSASALEETKKYWQAQRDGAEQGSRAFKVAEKNLKAVNDRQAELTAKQNSTMARQLLKQGNLQTMSEGDIRRAIEAAKQYQQTLKTGDPMYQRLTKAIVDAEEHIKQYGIEAERAARKDAAAQQQLADKHKLMQDRMQNLRNLSQGGLEETRKYWQAQMDGAERSSKAYKEAEKNLRAIADEQKRLSTEQLQQSAKRLGTRNLSTMSEQELQASIAAAKQLAATMQPNDQAYKQLIADILRAEQHIKQFGIEAERSNQQAAALATTMNKRMSNLKSLSADALAETKKYWEAQKAGAAEGTAEFNKAEAALKKIANLETRRKRDSLDSILGDPSKHGVAEVREAVREMEQLRDSVQKGTPAWLHYNKMVEQGREYLDRLAKSEAADHIEQQMQKIDKLSASGLQEVKKYWEAMVAGAEHGSAELDQYRQKLERVTQEERERAAITAQKQSASILSGNYTNMSESELRSAIESAKQYQQTLKTGDTLHKQYSEAIVKAENYLHQFGLEEERVAQKRKDTDMLMKKQLTEMTNQMAQHNDVSVDVLKSQHQYWQKLIDDPKNAGKNLQEYEDNLREVERLQRRMVGKQGQEAFDFFQRGDHETASMGEVKQQAEALKKWRDTLPQKTHADTIAKINEYLEQAGMSAKKAAEQTMSWKQAMQVSSQAGKGGFKGSIEQLTQAKKVLEEMSAKAVKGGLAWRRMQEALQRIGVELKNVGHLSQEVQSVLDSPKGRSFNALKQAVEQGRLALNAMDRTTKEGQKQFDELAKKVKAADQEMKQLAATSKGTSTAFEKAWSRVKTYVGVYVGTAVAMQKVTATMGDLMDLSDRMGEVRKTTGFTADEVGRLSENLKKMDVRTSLTSLMEISASAGQLGLKTLEDVQGFTEAANKLMIALPEMGREAATEMMRVAIATGEVDKIRKQLQEGTVEGSSATAVAMEKIASTIDRLRATSASTAPEITDFVKRVGAVGAQSGITIDQVAALGSTVSSLGMRVEMSATALSRMIPAIKTNAYDIGQIIGKTEKDIRERFAQGKGMEVILDVFDAIRNRAADFKGTEEELADSIEEMFGGNMKDVMKELNQMGARAGIVFSGLSQNVDELRRQLDVSADAYEKNVAIQQEFDKMNETTAAKWERLKNAFEEMWVGDSAQRGLGVLIDMLRKVVDWIAEDGPIIKGLKVMMAYWAAMKMNIGATIASMGAGFKAMGTAIGAGANVLATAAGAAINSMTGMTNSMRGLRAATVNARREWIKMDAAMRANIIGALVTALGFLVYKIWDMHQAAKEAAAEVGRFNQQLSNERKALNDMFEPLNKSNLAQEERLKLINSINSQYGKYLGYMLSETTSAQQLAEAHALIAKRIREEAYERRIAEKEKQVMESHSENVNAAYAGIESAVRGGARNGADVQAIADLLKGVVDNRLSDVNLVEYNTNIIDKALGKIWGTPDYVASGKIITAINGSLERLVLDGKLDRDEVGAIKGAVLAYAVEAKTQHNDIMSQTSNVRSDLRGIQGAIQTDLTNNLRGLIGNIANIAKQPQTPAPAPGGQGPLKPDAPSFRFPWQNGGQGGTGFGIFNFGSQQPIQMPLPSERPKINEKNAAEVRQYVEAQDQLRGYLKQYAESISESDREAAEAWLESESELARLRKIVANSNGGGGGGGGSNPYGSNTVMDPYEKWNANDLVKRRDQMLMYVKALANGADVQAVLAMDKKFMDEATRKGIKDMRDAIEWYNTERLKIQDELRGRHLTNTGNWLDPKESHNRKKRQVYSEEAVAELDRYYAWRKEEIERQRTEEGISEAEYNRRIELMEQEHLQKRSDLRRTFTKTENMAVKENVEKFWNWWKSVEELNQEIANEGRVLIDAEWKAATQRDKAYNDRDAQKDLTAMRAIVVKQMKAIEEIIAKERPYDGITENLEKNLTTMGILFADFDKRRKEALERGASQDEIQEIERLSGAERFKRLGFMLQEAEHAYMLTWDDLKERMQKAGFGDLVDAIASNENGERMQQALIAQLHTVYDQVQDAIKKESSLIKKQTENLWNDLLPDGSGMSLKDSYEKAISDLGLQEDQVKRANSLIGAGAASERVADRLAIQQLKIKLAMQQHYYALMQEEGRKRIAFLHEEQRLEEAKAKRHEAEARRLRQLGKEQEAETEEIKAQDAAHRAIQAKIDAEHATTSLQLAKSKELAEEEKQRVAIQNQLEESQNRLYTELRSWADLLTSSLQGVFEASHAGDAEYYNERAKLDLTGKGGPGAGTYVVIDDAGTSDAKAHYEYLDERQALERQHEIEIQNAQAEAWRKLMDDLNMKMSEQITDWMNAYLQNKATEDNTAELQRLQQKLEAEQQKMDASVTATDANTQAVQGLTQQLAEGITIKQDGTQPGATDGSDFAADKQAGYPSAPAEAPSNVDFASDKQTGYPGAQTDPANTAATDANTQAVQGLTQVMMQQGGFGADKAAGYPSGDMPSVDGSSFDTTDFGASKQAGYPSGGGELSPAAQQQINESNKVTETKIANKQEEVKTETEGDKKEQQSKQSMFAKMTAAANLYGVAYQAMSNDNLDTAQKFEMIALQAVGNAAIAGLQVALSQSTAQTAANMPAAASRASAEEGPIAGPILFAVLSALVGGLMGIAASKIAKSKSQIAQVTGASVGAGRLATGMLTYKEGNVNELTDPASLTPGRQYNVDGADGKTYRARYMGKGAKTHITNGPEFHLVGEAGREAIIDAKTTRLLQMNETGIWRDIQTLYNGGSISGMSTRRRRGTGVAAFADGNVGEFEDMADGGGLTAEGTGGMSAEVMTSMLETNSRLADLLENALVNGIKAVNKWTGSDGIPAMYNKMQKEAQRHGEKYL